MFGLSPWELLLVLVIVVLVFGGKRLKNLGSDLGSSIKGFQKAMREEDAPQHVEAQSKDAHAATKEHSAAN